MDLEKMCRVCLLPEGRVDLMAWDQPIDSLEYVLSYKDCFCQCTQINLSLNDDPSDAEDVRTQYLCLCCAQSLRDAHDFIEKAKKADNEIRSRKIDKNFEWVAVNAENVEIDKKEDPVVDDQNRLDEVNIWTNEITDVRGINLSNNIDDEDINIGNLKKELDEHSLVKKRKRAARTRLKRKALTLEDKPKSKDDEDSINYSVIVLPKERDHDTFSDKDFEMVAKKKAKCKVKAEKTKKNMDEMSACPVCQKVVTRRALIQHKYFHKPKIFLCKACPRTFSRAHTLKNHERTHEENRKRFPCEICDQSFLRWYSYKAHLKTHDTNRKPTYQCTQCDKTFLHKWGLLTHQLHHEGPKLKCSFCDKRYVRKSDLKLHLQSHSGENPYHCNVCDKRYLKKSGLVNHMQKHGDFFRYTCITCGEQFSSYYKYHTHRQQHFGLPYKCGVCEKKFKEASKCKRHIRGVHKIIDEAEVGKLTMRMYDTKEHRGKIAEVIKSPEEEESYNGEVYLQKPN